MPLPGFTAQITLTRSRRIYRSGGAYAARHAGAWVAPADVDPCSVDWLAVAGESIDAAFASAPASMDATGPSTTSTSARPDALWYHHYCHP